LFFRIFIIIWISKTKLFLITGASSGIGEASAIQFAKKEPIRFLLLQALVCLEQRRTVHQNFPHVDGDVSIG